jgi:hypothetical protein
MFSPISVSIPRDLIPMIRAAMITPNLPLGGAERWLTELIVLSDPTKLQWTGVAISGWGGADEHLVSLVLLEAWHAGVPVVATQFVPIPTGGPARIAHREIGAGCSTGFCWEFRRLIAWMMSEQVSVRNSVAFIHGD